MMRKVFFAQGGWVIAKRKYNLFSGKTEKK